MKQANACVRVMTAVALLATAFAGSADKVESRQGKVTLLLVQDQDRHGRFDRDPKKDASIEAQAVFKLGSEPETYGFKLRDGKDALAHEAMLQVLRDALVHNLTVRVDYTRKLPIPTSDSLHHVAHQIVVFK